ncbi:MAG: ABC transporter substrate-binding protein, partial [Candidatus Vogelbacteria bacterium]|nr:ABC transporter substrate-binding protein [Candidatus Vogelbacteria bacterium]
MESKNGLELAFSKLDPKIKDRVQLVVEDSKCDAKTGVDVANKLVNVDKVKYITGEICSSVVLATLPITEPNKVLMMSPGASSPAITGAGKYFFRTWPSDNYEGGVLADFAKNKLGLSKIAILSINNDYVVGLRDVFNSKFESLGGQIVVTENFDPSDKDFRTQLAKIKASNPDAIYLDSNPEEMPLVLKQVREMKLTQKLLANGPSIDGNTAIAKAGKNLADGVLYAYTAWKNP